MTVHMNTITQEREAAEAAIYAAANADETTEEEEAQA